MPSDLLHCTLDQIDYMLDVARRTTPEELVADETMKRAVSRSIESLGEAAKHMPNDFRDRRPDMPQKAISDIKDLLINLFFAADYNIVWNGMKNKLPDLKPHVARLLDKAKL